MEGMSVEWKLEMGIVKLLLLNFKRHCISAHTFPALSVCCLFVFGVTWQI
jgi:hypothetical protein